MPTSPVESITSALEGALPAMIRNGRVEALLALRMKKLVSLPAMSHVCDAKPEDVSCCRRSVGVSPDLTSISATGRAVPRPRYPWLLT